jgi:hypothetical protein
VTEFSASDSRSDASGSIGFDEFKAVLSANTAASGIRELYRSDEPYNLLMELL